jgi:hypothetical protein
MSRCCIIYNQPREGALADELDVLDQVEYIEKHLVELGIEVSRKGITDQYLKSTTLFSTWWNRLTIKEN